MNFTQSDFTPKPTLGKQAAWLLVFLPLLMMAAPALPQQITTTAFAAPATATFDPASGLLQVACIRNLQYFDSAQQLAPAYSFTARVRDSASLEILPESLQSLSQVPGDCPNLVGFFGQAQFESFPHYLFLPALQITGSDKVYRAELGLQRGPGPRLLNLLFLEQLEALIPTIEINSGDTRLFDISGWLSADIPVLNGPVKVMSISGKQAPQVSYDYSSQALQITGKAPGLYRVQIRSAQSLALGVQREYQVRVCAAGSSPCVVDDAAYLLSASYAQYQQALAIQESVIQHLKTLRTATNSLSQPIWCVALAGGSGSVEVPSQSWLNSLSDDSVSLRSADSCYRQYSVFAFTLQGESAVEFVDFRRLVINSDTQVTLDVGYSSAGYRYTLQKIAGVWQVMDIETLFIA